MQNRTVPAAAEGSPSDEQRKADLKEFETLWFEMTPEDRQEIWSYMADRVKSGGAR